MFFKRIFPRVYSGIMAPTRSFSLLLPVLLSTATAFRFPVTPKLFLKAPFSSFESEISSSTIEKVQKPPTVFVGNLPFAASEADIRSMITESIGDICTSFRVPIDRGNALIEICIIFLC